MKKVEVNAYICENCGVIHLSEEEIVKVCDKEVCTDCMDFYQIVTDDTYGTFLLH